MKLLDNEYVLEQIEEMQEKKSELTDERDKSLTALINDGSKENKIKYSKAMETLTRIVYQSSFYEETQSIRYNNSQEEVANYYKKRLEECEHMLARFEEIFKLTPQAIVSTMVNKKLEIEELKKFIDKEIYLK